MANENLSPAAIKIIVKEIKELNQNPPEGIKMIPNDEDFTDVQAIIDGPAGTPYEGGFFRVKLNLSSDFPQAPPKGYFLTKIFHPNVSPKGEICVNTLKKDWKPDLGIKHVLLTVKCLLIVPNPESALNEEAGRLLLERYEDYAKQAKLFTSIHASAKLLSKYIDAAINAQQNSQNSQNAANTITPAPSKEVTSTTTKDATTKKVTTTSTTSAAQTAVKKPVTTADKAKKSLKRL